MSFSANFFFPFSSGSRTSGASVCWEFVFSLASPSSSFLSFPFPFPRFPFAFGRGRAENAPLGSGMPVNV